MCVCVYVHVYAELISVLGPDLKIDAWRHKCGSGSDHGEAALVAVERQLVRQIRAHTLR